MLARCFCPKHGKLDFDDVFIEAGRPVCKKCKSPLDFGKVRPRSVEKPKAKKKTKKTKPKPKAKRKKSTRSNTRKK
jgi:hypothetical protein